MAQLGARREGRWTQAVDILPNPAAHKPRRLPARRHPKLLRVPKRDGGNADRGSRRRRRRLAGDQKRRGDASVPGTSAPACANAADALNARKNHVTSRSNGDISYIYLEDMEQMGEGESSNSFDDFAAQFYPAIRKAGLIIDVRRNAGGNIDTWILERLRRVAWMFNTRTSRGPGDTTMQYAFRGKVAVLVDEMTSSSDAEIFAAGVASSLGLGKVDRHARTWGGAVGYSSNPELALVDGSRVHHPILRPVRGRPVDD